MFAFCPAYEPSDEPQPIRIVFDGMPGFITTTLVALTLDDAERSCTRLNARLDLDGDAWWAIVARSMRGAGDGTDAGSVACTARARGRYDGGLEVRIRGSGTRATLAFAPPWDVQATPVPANAGALTEGRRASHACTVCMRSLDRTLHRNQN